MSELNKTTVVPDDMGDLQRAMVAIFSSAMTRIVARVLLIVFVVKLYGLESFGYLGEVAALVELLAALASFGLPKTLMAYLDVVKDDKLAEGKLISNAVALSALIGLVLGSALWLCWQFIFPPSSNVPAYAASAVILIAVTELMLTVTRSRRIIRWDALVKGVVKPWSFLLFSIGGYFLLVKGDNLSPVAALFAGYMAATILATVVALFGLFQSRKIDSFVLARPSGQGIRRLAAKSFPTAIVDTGAFSFRRLDIILLGLIAGPAATGIYYLVQQLATVVEKMRHLFEPMAAPVLAQAKSMAATGAHLKKLCLWIFSAQIGLAIIFVLFAAPVLALFDAKFASAALLMAIILIGEIAEGTSGLVELPLIFNAPKTASRNILIVILCESFFVAVGAYYFGILGAAGGFAAAMIGLAILRFWSARSALGLMILDASYAKPIGAAIVSITATMGLTMVFGTETIFKLVFLIITCAALYIVPLRLLGISLLFTKRP